MAKASPRPDPDLASDAGRPGLRLLFLGVAFTSGWLVMMLEILGGRVLAPYFGYSIYQWGALIGVVMAALALGYYLGGRVGDSPRNRSFLLWFLFAATLLAGLQPLLAEHFVPYARGFGPAWGAVVASAGLLGPISMLLATVSPIVIKLTLESGVARTAGLVYTVSTCGSIGGTFFAAFYAIPVLGTRISQYLAALLAAALLASLALAGRRIGPAALGLVAVLLCYPARPEAGPGVIYRGESIHNTLKVVDQGSRRFLYLNYEHSAQTLLDREALLTGQYFDLFLAGPLLADGGAETARRVLVLGVAGGTSLRQLAAVYPRLEITGVDLDPQVLEVAREYFGLAGEPRIELVAADARWFLARTEARYDLIAIDLFVTGQVPFFCTTREFFTQARERLAAGGVLMMNVVAHPPAERLMGPFVRTLEAVFPRVFVVPEGSNQILIATTSSLDLPELRQRLRAGDERPPLRPVLARVQRSLRAAHAEPHWPIFTDDRNDVELRSFQPRARR